MNDLCVRLGITFPLFAFSHCRDVVAAVSRAGVLGGSSFTPETLEPELAWIDAHTDGKPYGVDILIPERQAVGAHIDVEKLAAQVPTRHRDFVIDLLERHGVSLKTEAAIARTLPKTSQQNGEALMNIAFRHPIRFIVNALGTAPPRMVELARKHNVPVGALVGAKEHALKQLAVGVDVLITQGTEAAGHCGEVSTLVLVPEVLRYRNGTQGSGTRCRRHHDRPADGSLYGHGRQRRLDRFGVVGNTRSRDKRGF